jgi:hypothetical protein
MPNTCALTGSWNPSLAGEVARLPTMPRCLVSTMPSSSTSLTSIPTRAYLKALRDIAAGEEIFVSYGRDYWKSFAEQAHTLPVVSDPPVPTPSVTTTADPVVTPVVVVSKPVDDVMVDASPTTEPKEQDKPPEADTRMAEVAKKIIEVIDLTEGEPDEDPDCVIVGVFVPFSRSRPWPPVWSIPSPVIELEDMNM